MWTVATGLVLVVTVRFRRQRPLVALAVSTAVTSTVILGLVASGDGVVHAGVLVWVSYLAGRHSRNTRGFVTVIIAADVLLGAVRITLRGSTLLADAILSWFLLLLASLVFVVLPWLLGRYREQRFRLVSAGWERAERIEAEQRMALEQASLRERNRIAQGMHDSLGHELSLIALRAGALQVSHRLADEDREAVAQLRVAAAHATARLGEIVGVLRAGEVPAPTQPSVESVADIVLRAAASGMAVGLHRVGPPKPLSSPAQQAAVRVVQEALTNAAKHSPGAPVVVTMSFGVDELALSVSNGAPTGPGHAAASGGTGLVGLAERMRLIGGTLSVGPVGEGFAVEASVPYDAEIATHQAADDPEVISDAASEFAGVRQRARRGLVTGVAAPVAIGAAVGLLMLVYYVVIGYFSTLDPAHYDSVRVGQHRSQVEGSLPSLQMVDAPTENEPERPGGATCEYYRSGRAFTTTYAYRLCFTDGILVSKDRVQSGSTPIGGHP